jgi:hypothetical protein
MHFKVPHGIFLLEATSVAVDSEDNLYCFNRGNMPVLVFDPEGNMIRCWGNKTPYDGTMTYEDPYGNEAYRWKGTEYVRPHSIEIDAWDNIWLVDDMANVITKCDKYGRRLMMMLPGGTVLTAEEEEEGPSTASVTEGSGPQAKQHQEPTQQLPPAMAAAVGVVHAPPPKQSGSPFHRPTDIAVHPVTGELFVSDGYGNSRIHRFDSEGTHLQSWGEAGTDDGQFNIPHCISLLKVSDDNWHVLVADRENQRVQAFSTDGAYLYQVHAHRAVAVEAVHHQPVVAGGCDTPVAASILIAEQGSTSSVLCA